MRNTLLILGLFLFSSLKAQNIKGTLIDGTNNHPIEGGFVTLLTIPEKSLITSTYTEGDGKFNINGLANDSTTIIVSALGYKDLLIPVPPLKEDLSLGEIKLQLNKEIVLDDVVVTAKPYVLRKEVDRIVMSIPNVSEFTKNNTIWGMLRYTPMIKVDEVQGIDMLGKQHLVVYINGRKSTMSDTEVQNYLKSLPADNIKTIELITNPGSRFDVQANTGIINITLKRNEDEGLKGFASANMWQTHYNKQNGSLNLNYVRGKFDLKTTFSARNISDWSKSEDEILFPKLGLITDRNSVSENRRQLYYGNIDLSFRPDEKHTLGVIVDFGMSNERPKIDATSTYIQKSNPENPDSVLSSRLDTRTKTRRVAGNINYALNFNENNNLMIDLDYQYYKLYQKSNYFSSILNDNREPAPQNGYVQLMPQNNHLWMEQIEYTAKLGDSHKIILGSNGYISDSRNESNYSELHNLMEQYYPDSRFDYNEKSISGYLSYENQWNDKFSSGIGIRAEYTKMKGELTKPEEEAFSHNYWSFLPSVSLNYSPSERHYLWYSLSAQNEYPMYQYLNPFKSYQSSTVYSTGNINLKPSYTIYQELGYYLNSQYLFFLSQYITREDMDVLTVADGNMEVTSPVNYGKMTGYKIGVNINQSLFRNRWFINATLTGEYTQYNGNYANIDINQDCFSGELNIDNTIVLSKKYSWNLLCNYQFRTPYKKLMTKINSDMRGSVEIRKNIKQLAISASYYRSWNYNGNNYSSVRKSTYITPDMERRTLSVGEYQGFMLSVSYNFGNKKVKSSKRHQMVTGSQKGRYSGNK